MEAIEFILFLSAVSLFIWFCYYMANKFKEKEAKIKYDNKTFVNITTKQKYHIENFTLYKNPIDKKWYQMVSYKPVNSETLYIRESSEFFREFITLEEYNNENK